MEKLNNELKAIASCTSDIVSLQEEQKEAITQLNGDRIESITEATDAKMANLESLKESADMILNGESIDDKYPELMGIKKKIRKSIDQMQRNNLELQVKLMASTTTINSILVASGLINKKTTYSRDLK